MKKPTSLRQFSNRTRSLSSLVDASNRTDNQSEKSKHTHGKNGRKKNRAGGVDATSFSIRSLRKYIPDRYSLVFLFFEVLY